MKNVKIEIPKGYEIDESKSTFTNIVFKKIEDKYPNSILDVKGRDWAIGGGEPFASPSDSDDIDQVSTKKSAEAFLALMQLVELRDAYNKVDGFMVDWSDDKQDKFIIWVYIGELDLDCVCRVQYTLHFGKHSTRDLFFERFKDLIEIAKPLI